MAKIKTKTVQIAIGMHNALTALVAAKAIEGNGRVTLRDVVEDAIRLAYPQLNAPTPVVEQAAVEVAAPEPVTPPMPVAPPPPPPGAESAASLFNRILQAAFATDGQTMPKGVILGPSSKPIRLRELVAHLRDKMPPVSTLAELIDHFEESAVGSVKPS